MAFSARARPRVPPCRFRGLIASASLKRYPNQSFCRYLFRIRGFRGLIASASLKRGVAPSQSQPSNVEEFPRLDCLGLIEAPSRIMRPLVQPSDVRFRGLIASASLKRGICASTKVLAVVVSFPRLDCLGLIEARFVDEIVVLVRGV